MEDAELKTDRKPANFKNHGVTVANYNLQNKLYFMESENYETSNVG